MSTKDHLASEERESFLDLRQASGRAGESDTSGGRTQSMETVIPCETTADELGAALADRRVARALHFALRDTRMRRRFTALRNGGLSVDEAVERLRGPHRDASGRPYYLSEERVRAVVYRK